MSYVFYYTTGDVIGQIIGLGVINPSKNDPTNLRERATVMFSSNEDWENSRYQVYKDPSGQPILMGKELLQKFGNGLFRVAVKSEVAPIDWKTLKLEGYISQDILEAVYRFALDVGAKTSEWSFSFEPIPESQWEAVEKLVDGKWISLEEVENDKDTPEEIEEEKQNDLEWRNTPTNDSLIVLP